MHKVKFVFCQLLLMIMLIGCQKVDHKEKKQRLKKGRLLESFISGVMHNYTAYYSKKDTNPKYIFEVRGSLRPNYFFTIGATYKGDTIKILLPELWDLIKLSKALGVSTDSLTLVNFIKGEELIQLTSDTFEKVSVIKKCKRVDSLAANGKQQTLDYYFSDNGFMRSDLHLSSEEEGCLIDYLCNWGVLVMQDDESGFFRLERNFQNDAIKYE